MDQGYKTIFWSMAFLDYDVNNQPGSEYVVNHFNKYHHSGAIVLLHNVSQSDTEALETVLVNMREAGYRFGTLDELN
jgi:peptidoglycan-N-acetylmuramic acid deacetylase